MGGLDEENCACSVERGGFETPHFLHTGPGEGTVEKSAALSVIL